MGVEYRHYLLPEDRTYLPDARCIADLVEALRYERWVFDPSHPAFGEQFMNDKEIPAHRQTGGHAFRTMPNPHAPRPLRAAEAAIPIPLPITPAWIDAQRDVTSDDAQRAELQLVFPVDVPDVSFDDVGMRYPFTFGSDDGALYHEIVIDLARDYVHHSAECTDPIDTRCACGAELEYDADACAPRAVWLAIRFESRIRSKCPSCGRAFDPRGRPGRRASGYTGKQLPSLDGGGAYRFAVIVDCGKGWTREGGEIAIAPAFVELCESITKQRLVDFGEFY